MVLENGVLVKEVKLVIGFLIFVELKLRLVINGCVCVRDRAVKKKQKGGRVFHAIFVILH